MHSAWTILVEATAYIVVTSGVAVLAFHAYSLLAETFFPSRKSVSRHDTINVDSSRSGRDEP